MGLPSPTKEKPLRNGGVAPAWRLPLVGEGTLVLSRRKTRSLLLTGAGLLMEDREGAEFSGYLWMGESGYLGRLQGDVALD
jgi:hypothetical protein